MELPRNTLFYGDNLVVLREHIADASVDLIYLDPPFNSNRNYNVLFKNDRGQPAEAQVQAFVDTWRWGESAERAYHDLTARSTPEIAALVSAFRQFLGTSQMMAYLVMMAVRLVELHRVLKPTGSLYLHCDPTASHYLKVVLDTLFGPVNFLNHVTWGRSDTHNDAQRRFPCVSDHILAYAKSKQHCFNKQHTVHADKTLREWYQYLEFADGTVRKMTKKENETQQIPDGARRFNTGDMTSPNPRPNLMYDYKGYPHPPNGWRCSLETMQELDANGLLLFPSAPNGRIMRKRYLDEQVGPVIGDLWVDVSQLRAADAERLGYPTQKPVALLERIIAASSNPGDIVLDPFCGCGTTIAAAQELDRQWIGIDITHLSIALQKYRLSDAYGLMAGKDYEVFGEPVDLDAARQLALDNRYQFQWWALSLVQARPMGGDVGSKKGKKGADQGIDGVINFFDDATLKVKRVLVQVKSGKVTSRDIRDLRGVIDREGAPMGLFITLEPPSAPMVTEVASAGFYCSPGWQRDFPRLQVFTIEELLAGRKPELPNNVTMQRAPKEQAKAAQYQKLLFHQDAE